MPKTFAISAMGRSGTTFLANLMNRSLEFEVHHELDDMTSLPSDAAQIQERFAGGRNYGEVSSGLRFVLPFLDVNYKGVILRDPVDIFVSFCNRRNDSEIAADIHKFTEHWESVDYMASCPAIHVIRFERMVSSVSYTEKLLRSFGIYDVVVTKSDIDTPVNRYAKIRFRSIYEIPAHFVDDFFKRSNWFIGKHNYA